MNLKLKHNVRKLSAAFGVTGKRVQELNDIVHALTCPEHRKKHLKVSEVIEEAVVNFQPQSDNEFAYCLYICGRRAIPPSIEVTIPIYGAGEELKVSGKPKLLN